MQVCLSLLLSPPFVLQVRGGGLAGPASRASCRLAHTPAISANQRWRELFKVSPSFCSSSLSDFVQEGLWWGSGTEVRLGYPVHFTHAVMNVTPLGYGLLPLMYFYFFLTLLVDKIVRPFVFFFLSTQC